MAPTLGDAKHRLGSKRLTGALLDRLTHDVNILTMNGDSYRLKQSAARRRVFARGVLVWADIAAPDASQNATQATPPPNAGHQKMRNAVAASGLELSPALQSVGVSCQSLVP